MKTDLEMLIELLEKAEERDNNKPKDSWDKNGNIELIIVLAIIAVIGAIPLVIFTLN